LKDGGWMLLEMSDDMVPKAKRIYKKAGFREVAVASDEDELSMVLEAEK
jgi:methylase of polypeptide subunit release factors